ncbi:MAG: hypothetical protein ABIR18_01460 [Chitinophagaceae bacterium]
MKKCFLLILVLFQLISISSTAQSSSCRAVRTGTFKVVSKESGTTLIKRGTKFQTEINKDLGVEIILSIKWTSSCSYELRPVKLVKGDPAMMGDGKTVITTKIKNITKHSYIAETSMTGSDVAIQFQVEILD